MEQILNEASIKNSRASVSNQDGFYIKEVSHMYESTFMIIQNENHDQSTNHNFWKWDRKSTIF